MDLHSWRPDWKNNKAYPDAESTPDGQWAWEFLRRSEDYQQTFNNYAEFITDDKFQGWYANLVWNFDNLQNYNLACQKFKVVHLVNPARNFAEAIQQTSEKSAPPLGFRVDFGCLQEYSPHLETEARSGGVYCKNFMPPLPEKWGEVLVKFDLAIPLSIQFEKLEKALSEMQQSLYAEALISDFNWTESSKPVKEAPAALLKYIQILDAVSAGKTEAEIAEVLDGKKSDNSATSAITKQLSEAQKYCASEYYKLVVYSHKISANHP